MRILDYEFNVNITDMLILSVIKAKESSIDRIGEQLKQYSNNKVNLQPGKVYSHVFHLEKMGALNKIEKPRPSGTTETIYRITPIGEVYLSQITNNYYLTVSATDSTMHTIEASSEINAKI